MSEREAVFIHLARVKTAAMRFDEARAQLEAVTNDFYADLDQKLECNLAQRESNRNQTPRPTPRRFTVLSLICNW